MPLTIGTPCGEDWDAMEVRGRGRHCASCDHIVVDLARMTRERAEAFVRDRRGHRVCGRLLIDSATGEPWFPPSEAAPVRFRGGLVLAAALGGAGCAGAEPTAAEVTEEPAAPVVAPMEPVTLATVAPAPGPTTGPVPAAELTAPVGEATPTPEQQRLTANKRARRHPVAPVAAHPPPHAYPLLGDVYEP